METIGDLAYDGSHGSDNIVYILEGGQYVPFIVLTNNYNKNTLLLRRDALDTTKRINNYSSLYQDSEIDKFLNSEYLTELSDIQPFILSSEIIIMDESSLGISGNATMNIERKVFLLSCTETGIDDSVNCGREGVPLKYFNDNEDKRAYCSNGTLCSWWLRTPNTYYLSATYVIGANNKLGSTNAFDNNGIRPAFCVSSSLKVELSEEIVANQSVYVFSYED